MIKDMKCLFQSILFTKSILFCVYESNVHSEEKNLFLCCLKNLALWKHVNNLLLVLQTCFQIIYCNAAWRKSKKYWADNIYRWVSLCWDLRMCKVIKLLPTYWNVNLWLVSHFKFWLILIKNKIINNCRFFSVIVHVCSWPSAVVVSDSTGKKQFFRPN